jgi:hypothetical protein
MMPSSMAFGAQERSKSVTNLKRIYSHRGHDEAYRSHDGTLKAHDDK